MHCRQNRERETARRAHGTCALSIVGDIDEFTVGLFEAKLERVIATARFVIVDLEVCSLISTAGLQALARIRRQVREGGSLCLVTTDPNVVKLLEIVGLAQAIPCYPTFGGALAAVSAGQAAQTTGNAEATAGPAAVEQTVPRLALVPPPARADAGAPRFAAERRPSAAA